MDNGRKYEWEIVLPDGVVAMAVATVSGHDTPDTRWDQGERREVDIEVWRMWNHVSDCITGEIDEEMLDKLYERALELDDDAFYEWLEDSLNEEDEDAST